MSHPSHISALSDMSQTPRATMILDTSTRVTRPSVVNAMTIGGAAYIAASVGFIAVFSWLASNFGYPEILDRPAADVLPRLAALGAHGRAVWAIYAVLPLLLVPASVGAAAAVRGSEPRNESLARLGLVLSVVAAIAMALGLARWSTAQWTLANAWAGADGSERHTITLAFDALNAYLGRAVGEFLGELALYGAMLAFAIASRRMGSRWIAALGIVTGVCGWTSMFRNVTPVVLPVSSLTNMLLPIYLVAFGVWLMRAGARPSRGV